MPKLEEFFKEQFPHLLHPGRPEMPRGAAQHDHLHAENLGQDRTGVGHRLGIDAHHGEGVGVARPGPLDDLLGAGGAGQRCGNRQAAMGPSAEAAAKASSEPRLPKAVGPSSS